ncbi:MAG TPA: hypothetical protein V6C98_11695 [Thermosynechococcaceae cyanobacterium]
MKIFTTEDGWKEQPAEGKSFLSIIFAFVNTISSTERLWLTDRSPL